MEDVAISVADVVKQYKVRHQKGRTLKEAFLRQRIFSETFDALNHVSFEVPFGTTLGFIGSNGSGKSTVLKLIAGTSKPSSGRVRVMGRVSALLELGAGFHPDFTGRENVYLDGVIMGRPRSEIDRRFDDIVAFAEMEEFIDAPAKTYSSGMFMRLAFSVAVSVDPDILLVDEVLSVGDESFQRKCLSRIDEFKSQGKTIIFVSHAMGTVRNLCDRVIWIDRGVISADGDPNEVIDQYLTSVNERDRQRLEAEAGAASGELPGPVEIASVKLLDRAGEEKLSFNTGDYLKVQVDYRSHAPVEAPVARMLLKTADGILCAGASTEMLDEVVDRLPAEGTVELEIEQLPLLPGSYNIAVFFQNQDGSQVYNSDGGKYPFDVAAGMPYETGIIHVPCRWLNWSGNGK